MRALALALPQAALGQTAHWVVGELASGVLLFPDDGVASQVTVLTGAEVVCVDGVHAVEAVVIRRIRTGQLIGVNASAILSGCRLPCLNT